MAFIVKESTTDLGPISMRATAPVKYDLFTAEIVKDINEIDVTVPKSAGVYLLEDLIKSKGVLQAQLADVEDKIKDIEAFIKAKDGLKI
jgi:hypothetical protein